MAQEFIVAIELGSSKITGVAGRKNADGSFTILASAKENSTSCIRKGVVYNIDKTVQTLTNIINKLEASLGAKIAQVYVGVGGQSIRSIKNTSVKELPADTTVSQSMVIELMDNNRSMDYPEQEILDAIPQEYKVDQQYQLEPVGIQCMRLEGNFLNILWHKTFYRNLNKCLEKANITIAELYLAPLALADSVLTENEKRSGCMLVDMGADTTTVLVYYKDILRHIAVIPLGGNNITKDIASLQIDEASAEQLKLKYAKAYTESKDVSDEPVHIDNDRTVEASKFVEIVEGRVQEIIRNAWYQVPDEYLDKMIGGIVLTGGMANMKNIDRAFTNVTKVAKVRVANFINQVIKTTMAEEKTHNCMMNTVLGLLVKGDMNCAGDELTGDIFNDAQGRTSASVAHKTPRTPGETTGQGRVKTEAEKKQAEEERKRKEQEEADRKAEEEAARKAEEEAARKAEEERKRQNSFLNRTLRGLRDFGKNMLKADDE